MLDEYRYDGLTGVKAVGRTPESDTNWARAVIIATMYKEKKTRKLKKAPKIEKNMRYWYSESVWERMYTKSDNTVAFVNVKERSEVTNYQQYATTVFFGIKNDYKYQYLDKKGKK